MELLSNDRAASTWSFSIRPQPGFVGNGPAVVIGQWTHLVLTYDGTVAKFYVNGSLINTYAVPLFLVQNNSRNMVMGAGPATGFDPFNGELDEIALYNYALSLSQVTNHYQVGTKLHHTHRHATLVHGVASLNQAIPEFR